MSLEITCTRVEADHKQLLNCISTLDTMEVSFEKTAQLLSIAGNQVRLKILYLLNMEKELCPCDLADVLGMSVPAVSQHLRKMKDRQIIEARRSGQTIFYSIILGQLHLLQPLFKHIINQNAKKELV